MRALVDVALDYAEGTRRRLLGIACALPKVGHYWTLVDHPCALVFVCVRCHASEVVKVHA